MPRTPEHAVIDAAERELLLTAAVAAPSVHNSQPWTFDVGRQRVDLFADTSRQLTAADETGRSLLISCGAALFNLRVAFDHLGYHPRVRVLPDPADPTHVASLEVDHRHRRPGSLAYLYPSIPVRRTNRRPFEDRRTPASVLSLIAEAASLEGAVMRIYEDPVEVDRIVALLRSAEGDEHLYPELERERSRWVATDRTSDGIPAASLGPRPADREAAVRDLGRHLRGDYARPVSAFEKAPTVAVLSTMTDRPTDWVRSGQALERALLVATGLGVSASFMNQPLEQAGLRWLARSPMSGLGNTQMILRLGYGAEVPPTPRRPLAEVLRGEIVLPGEVVIPGPRVPRGSR